LIFGAEGCLFTVCFDEIAEVTFVCEVDRATAFTELEDEEFCTSGTTLDPEAVPINLGELLVDVDVGVVGVVIEAEDCFSDVVPF